MDTEGLPCRAFRKSGCASSTSAPPPLLVTAAGYPVHVACYAAVVPPVSERDRDYLARLGALKDASHHDAEERHYALPLAERLERSWALYLAGRETARLDLRADDPSPFYARARALGLLLA